MFLSGHKCKTNYYCTKPDNCKAKSYKNVIMGKKVCYPSYYSESLSFYIENIK